MAVDLDQPPFVQWKARGNFVSKLLGYPARGNEGAPDRSVAGQAATTGLTDLTSQLRGALDQFAGVKLVPFSVVALLVFGYILLIGPGDYFLVQLAQADGVDLDHLPVDRGGREQRRLPAGRAAQGEGAAAQSGRPGRCLPRSADAAGARHDLDERLQPPRRCLRSALHAASPAAR